MTTTHGYTADKDRLQTRLLQSTTSAELYGRVVLGLEPNTKLI